MALVMLNSRIFGEPKSESREDLESFMAQLPKRGYGLVLLAHASQALVGSAVLRLIAPTSSDWAVGGMGVMGLLGGVVSIQMIPCPRWFAVADCLVYLPAAFLGAALADRKFKLN